jgi:uncharacterized protein
MKPNPQERLLPQATPETEHFWAGAREGELRLQHCAACDHNYFPPQAFCPRCHSDAVSVFMASGKGTLYGFNISHLPAPGLQPPYVIAVVELEEGPRMMSNLVDCDATPETVRLDMPLEVTFQKQNDEISLPLFRPAAR